MCLETQVARSRSLHLYKQGQGICEGMTPIMALPVRSRRPGPCPTTSFNNYNLFQPTYLHARDTMGMTLNFRRYAFGNHILVIFGYNIPQPRDALHVFQWSMSI